MPKSQTLHEQIENIKTKNPRYDEKKVYSPQDSQRPLAYTALYSQVDSSKAKWRSAVYI